ncbi:MAG: ABC transporter permease [Oscillospiraceae bacterium]|nr:ABC transporter permease [Oscillospiraceae bacterium]
MNRVLNKRILRDLKSNFLRYLALFLLIAMGMYIIVAMIASAETIIQGTEENAEKNHLEDGQFAVFAELTASQEREISDMGITLEKMFSFDVDMEDGSVLRIFKNRENIDIVCVEQGVLAEKSGEICLEKRYCEENNISVGDTVKIGGNDLIVTGIGSALDYDSPTKNISDASVQSKIFGIGFVTDEQYDMLKKSGKTEDLRYAYLLNGKATHDELKDTIKEFELDFNEITDEYLLEMVNEVLDKRKEIQEGVSELKDGAEELCDGLSELNENGKDFAQAVSDYTDGAAAAYEGSKELTDGLSDLDENGSAIAQIAPEYAAGVTAAYNGSNALSEGLSQLDENGNTLSRAAKDYTDGVSAAYDGSVKLADGISELQKETDKLLDEIFEIDIDNLTEFIEAENNPRIKGCAGDVIMNKNIGMLVGIILIALLAYVISVFVIHQIQRESSVIGALYALGAKKNDLIRYYVLLPTLISLLGGAAGTAIGFTDFAMNSITGDSYSYYSLPVFETVYPVYLLIYGIVMPPVISAIVNALVINKRLSQTALSLIKNEQKTNMVREMDLGNTGFIRRFQIRQLTREARTSLTVIAGMLFSLFIVMIGVDCYVMCNNYKTDSMADTEFEYMYTLKYPEETVPENAEACYMESLSKTDRGYTLDVNIIGIDSDNKYYNAKPEKGKNKVVIGSAAAQKYGLKKGDKLILTDSASDTDYAFTVMDTADYAVNLAVFMDIDSMRELFGADDDYYNVLLSDKALDIDSGRIYAVTTRSDIERSTGVFTDLMMPMVVMMTSVSAIIFFVVIFLMMNVMIDRAAFGISLVKIFGFRTNEIRRLYLNGNTAIVAIGAVICIPAAKVLTDKLYPSFIANVACGMNIAFPWYLYTGLFCAVMAVYFIVNTVLVNKLKKISPAEALKNRE